MLSILRARPKLSIVVVVYRMREQASRTLLSLAPGYQRDVTGSEYEIIVVENDSDSLLGAERVTSVAANVRYFHRNETQPTPVNAVNFGAAQARGNHVAIIVDGARMLTPGVIRLSLDAMCMDPRGAVAVPGYHLGHRPQQEAVDHGYDATEEAELLAGIHWPSDGYRLFDIAALSTSAREGFVLPSPESNFLATTRDTWRAIGGMNTHYDSHGGGYANHDLYKRVLERPGTRCYFLFGEGCFHQYHGGVTTGTPGAEREWIYESILEQDIRIRGDDRAPPQNAPVFFGSLHPAAYRFLTYSIEQAAAAQNTRQPQREK